MPEERRWSDAELVLVWDTLGDVRYEQGSTGQAAAVLDALTAAGWRPPPPEPDGVHWRTGGSVGRTVYDPHGRLVGLLDTPELARAAVDAMNADAERPRVTGEVSGDG